MIYLSKNFFQNTFLVIKNKTSRCLGGFIFLSLICVVLPEKPTQALTLVLNDKDEYDKANKYNRG